MITIDVKTLCYVPIYVPLINAVHQQMSPWQNAQGDQSQNIPTRIDIRGD
jgi:hypothetical protein